MFNKRGSSLVSTVLAVAAAGGVGVAGYYLVSGSCGSCSTDVAAATPVAAATDAKSDCGGCTADVMTVAATDKADCTATCDTVCEGMTAEECAVACETACTGEGVEVVAVANEAEGCATECATECTDEQKAECAEKAACGTDVMLVSNEAEEGDCEKSCEGEAKVCPVTGQPIADAGN